MGAAVATPLAWLARLGRAIARELPLGLLVVAPLAFDLLTFGVGVDDFDEGFFAAQTARVLHGQVPFRDFEALYAPGLLYLHVGVAALLGGPHLLGLRAVALVGRAALAALTLLLARRVARPRWAVVPPAFLLLALDAAPDRWEPHPGWLSTAFALLAVWLLPRGPAEVGLAAGLAFAFKQNTGLLVLGAAGLLLARRPGSVARLLAGFGLVTAAWLVPLVLALGGDVRPLAPLVGGVNQAALFSPPEPLDLLPVACAAAGLLALARPAWFPAPDAGRTPPQPPPPRPTAARSRPTAVPSRPTAAPSRPGGAPARWWRGRLIAYLVAGCALLGTEYPRMDVLHLAWSAPLLLVVGAAVADRLPARAGVACAVLVALAAVPMLDWRTRPLRGEATLRTLSVAVLPLADGVRVPAATADDLVATVEDVRRRAAPGEPIFVYPSSPLVYVLADRPNPTPFDHLYPGAASPDRGVPATLAALDGVRVVVVSEFWRSVWEGPGAGAGPGPGPGSGSGSNAPIEAYLATRFAEVRRHGAYRILERQP